MAAVVPRSNVLAGLRLNCVRFTWRRQFGLGPARQASRFLNPKTKGRLDTMAVAHMDKKVERELERIARVKKLKQKREALLSFYQKSAVLSKNFIYDMSYVLKEVKELRGLGMVLTKKKVDMNFSQVSLFWSSSTKSNEALIHRALMEKSDAIRAGATKRCGQLPQLVFVHDAAHLQGSAMEELFNNIKAEVNTAEKAGLLDALADLRLEDQVGGLNRTGMIKAVQHAKERTKALHRVDREQEDNFKADYLRSVENHPGAKKREMNKKIKKFLAERHKMAKPESESNACREPA